MRVVQLYSAYGTAGYGLAEAIPVLSCLGAKAVRRTIDTNGKNGKNGRRREDQSQEGETHEA